MRTRTTTLANTVEATETKWYTKSSSGAPWVLGGTIVGEKGLISTKTIVDTKTPGFYALRKCGKFLPLNPVQIETRTYQRNADPGATHTAARITSPIFQTLKFEPYVATLYGATNGGWGIEEPVWDESLIGFVGNAAFADMQSASWDMLTSIAELKQTYALVTDRMSDMFDLMDRTAIKARRRGKGSYQASLTEFLSLWLEARYGWRPLVFDVKSSLDALAGKLAKGDLVRGRASSTVTLNQVASGVYGDVSGTSAPRYSWVCILEGTRKYRGASYGEVIAGELTRIQFDPLLTAYEIIPLSFVFDWFWDVNSWLSTVTPFKAARPLGTMISVRDSYTLTQYVDGDYSYRTGSAPNVHQHSGSASCSVSLAVDSYTRFPFEGSLPQWNPRLTPLRLVDLAALILTRKAGVFRRLTG